MKKITGVYICLFLSVSVISQDSIIVDRVIFKYNVGGYRWGAPGVFSRNETILFKKSNKLSNGYFLEKYYKIEKRTLPDSVHTTTDTFPVVHKMRKVSADLITKLLFNLSTSKENFTSSFILPYLRKPERNDIKSVAVKNKYGDNLFGQYSDRKKTKQITQSIKDFHLIDSFILEQKNWAKYYFMTTDYYDMYRIEVVMSNNDTMAYSSQFSQPLAQPILWSIKRPNKEIRNVYNVDVNLIIQNILPLKSQLRKKVDLNSLMNEYILWYLKRRFG